MTFDLAFEPVVSPLVDRILQRKENGKPFTQGVTGPQGVGKSTLCSVLVGEIEKRGYQAVSLSIDDFYLPYAERRQWMKSDPNLTFRGPPGSHSVDLMEDLFASLLDESKGSVRAPRFDKAILQGQGDRIGFQEMIKPIDVLLFEGWFVGFCPVPDSCLLQSDLPEIRRNPQLALRCNHRLAEYQPIWDYLNGLIIMEPQSWDDSLGWRLQAEDQMRRSGRGGMSDHQVAEFVAYFNTCLHPQIYYPALQRRPGAITLHIQQDHTASM